jgi:signal transduction histidine kinase
MEGIEDISSMADDLLDLRRIDTEDLIDVQKVSPADLLAKVVEEMQPQIMNRKIQVIAGS